NAPGRIAQFSVDKAPIAVSSGSSGPVRGRDQGPASKASKVGLSSEGNVRPGGYSLGRASRLPATRSPRARDPGDARRPARSARLPDRGQGPSVPIPAPPLGLDRVRRPPDHPPAPSALPPIRGDRLLRGSAAPRQLHAVRL